MFASENLPFHTNRLLAALPANEYERMLPSLESISLKIRDNLYQPDETIEYVYFPLTGMASILVMMSDGTMIEAGVVGYEGMVGLPVFMGAEKTPTRSFYQVAGEAVRMSVEAFRAEIRLNGKLTEILQRYTLAYFGMLAQNGACNSQHAVGQRCARWLLLTLDRIGGTEFELTQEFLSQMLGVRRAGVSGVMGALQEAGAIQYSRGIITILDRAKLEHDACECYRVITAGYERMPD